MLNTKRSNFLTACMLICACSGSWAETIARQYQPLTEVPQDSLTRQGEFVMVELYKQFGLTFELPWKKGVTPEPGPAPQPVPPPAPAPAPEPNREPGFFDDDFFDDDMDFDDVVEGFDEEYEQTVAAWDKEYEETLARWGLAQKKYQESKSTYLQATYDFDNFAANRDFDANTLAARDTTNAPSEPGDFHIIPYAFTQSIQDQASRGTCAAFAGVRAIETLISQHDVNTDADIIDLSEQQFFFLARVDCMQAPCRPKYDKDGNVTNDGSNYDIGFDVIRTLDHPIASLADESDCPYRPTIENNVSYSPVDQYCSLRSATRYRVSQFNTKIPFDSVLSELRANRPVAASFRLPNSFFDSAGLVSLIDPKTGQGTGPHAGGHAIALVGYVMLPQSFWAVEGKYCAITANSWGEGWGVGGYGCLTENWMRKFYKYSSSIAKVNQVRI